MTVDAHEETIYARASGAGKAGVAVFRLSGAGAHPIATAIIGKKTTIRMPALAMLRDPASGAPIDRGLVILFAGPASFTGEDVAEFHLHGSSAVEAFLFETLSRLGARPAEAGEFTLRAFRNGKLDLAQAEALADLIDSETTLQRMQALGQLDGRLSSLAAGWRKRLIAVLAPLEADIDFPDEGDVPAAVAARAGIAIHQLKEELIIFLNQSRRARMIRRGAAIAVIGAPNAGKSSLVNALAGAAVAIVSDQPGTTRDVVEARLDLDGVLLTIADTAGLRGHTDDPIEREGMARAKQRAEDADFRILVIDPGDVSRETQQFSEHLLRPGDFIVWSKADKFSPPAADLPEGVSSFSLSSKTGAGLDALTGALREAVAGDQQADGAALTRARHVAAVEKAIDALSRAEALIERAPELAAEDARLAARALGGITGAVGVEDILGEIFSRFCIGK